MSNFDLSFLHRLPASEQAEFASYWEATQADIIRGSFSEFVKFAFSITDPVTQYIHNWHIDLITEYLGLVEQGVIRKLIINVPPRSLKSLIVNQAWPAWLLGHNPAERIVSASYGMDLAIKNSVKTRLIMENEFYKKMFPKTRLAHDNNQKMQFSTTEMGHRVATSTGSGITGEGGNILIVDDLSSALDAQSDTIHEGQIAWYDTSFSNRLNDKKNGAIVVIMQRLREDDLTGHLMASKTGWVKLKLPIYTDKDIRFTRFEPRKTYTFKKGLLHEARMDWDYVKGEEKKGSFYFSGQFLQEPTPAGGGIIKKAWFTLWEPSIPLPRMTYVLQSYDTAFTANTLNDPSACLTIGVFNKAAQGQDPNWAFMILDWWNEHLEFPELEERAKMDYKLTSGRASKLSFGINKKHVDLLVVEEKATGKPVIQRLQRAAGLPILGYTPTTDKIQRVNIVSPIVETGKIYVMSSGKPPIPEGYQEFAAWVQPFIKEVCTFPKAPHDEAPDTLSQALITLEHMEFTDVDHVDLNPSRDPDEPVEYRAERSEEVYG